MTEDQSMSNCSNTFIVQVQKHYIRSSGVSIIKPWLIVESSDMVIAYMQFCFCQAANPGCYINRVLSVSVPELVHFQKSIGINTFCSIHKLNFNFLLNLTENMDRLGITPSCSTNLLQLLLEFLSSILCSVKLSWKSISSLSIPDC